MEELITIIEGPTPEFQPARESWAWSLIEGARPLTLAMCQTRTIKGEKMLERCRRAWREGRPVRLDYRRMDGLRKQVDILAARYETVEGVDVLYLWVGFGST